MARADTHSKTKRKAVHDIAGIGTRCEVSPCQITAYQQGDLCTVFADYPFFSDYSVSQLQSSYT